MISARSITKSYGDVEVLRGVSFDVESGTIHGFVGPNGAGKSTFLKSLVGVVRPCSGELVVDGIDAIEQSLEARRRIGYAPAETSLYHRLRVGELLEFAIRYHPGSDKARGLELLDSLGVPVGRKVGVLSHGMKRKLILSQAIATNAPVMILDEPMEALDPEARRIVEQLMHEEASAGRTILLSSHDLFSTQRLCSRVTFLHRGSVLRDGLVSELLSGRAGRLHIEFSADQHSESLPKGAGLEWTGLGASWQLRFDRPLGEVLLLLGRLPVSGIRDDAGSLEDLFDNLYDQSEVSA